MKFYPYEKRGGGGGKGFSHAKEAGGGATSCGVVLTWVLKVVAKLKIHVCVVTIYIHLIARKNRGNFDDQSIIEREKKWGAKNVATL